MSLLKKIFGNSNKSFADRLEQQGYFKYCSSKEIKTAKVKIDKEYSNQGILSMLTGQDNIPTDLRYYFCDGESIHEKYGYRKFISYIKPTLEELGIYDSVCDSMPNSSPCESHIDSVYFLISSINKILNKNNINENLYPIFGGNDGQVILLTLDQFEFIRHSIKDAKSRPFEVNAWKRLVHYNKNASKENQILNVGDRVNHQKFGFGKIMEISEKGLASIHFEKHGIRQVILKYAKLKIM